MHPEWARGFVSPLHLVSVPRLSTVDFCRYLQEWETDETEDG
jgi:hypothetical protein